MDGSEDALTNRRFLLDVMLGKLATYLRMAGYDAAYALDRGVEDDDLLLQIAEDEDRTLLTRDEQLAERAPDGLLLTERDVTDQLRELVDAGIELSIADPPTRCSNCNGRLEQVAHPGRESTGERSADESVPEHVPDDVTAFRCLDCGQWFWRGSHWADVRETLAML